MSPEYARQLLEEYVDDLKVLSREPRWYNTATGYCTTLVFGMVHKLRPGLPLNYRILLSGYLPNYAYDVGQRIPACPSNNFSQCHESTTKRCRLVAILITQE
jgi:hypothetical protein